jgi:hypothetical protein
MRTPVRVIFFFLSTFLVPGQAGSAHPVIATGASTMPPAIVIGFVGGFVKHDNLVHSEVQVAAHLSEDYSAGVYVKVFENYHGERAHKEILRLLDTNHDGALSVDEKLNARIVIYGHSWGASETITLARRLERDGIPVLLTIQVDSLAKIGQNDTVIPANVAQAVNFYQTKGLLHGRPEIRAADAARTRIIGNFRFDYRSNPLRCAQYPWFDRIFVKPHTEIECDPTVWNQVEDLIRLQLPPPRENGAAQRTIR